jgi:L-lactate dehydrogenase complex protein LldG
VPALQRRTGRAEARYRAALSCAVTAAAETGTLFLVSGNDNPTTLAFLPESHFILVRAGDVVGSYEEAFDRLRALYGERHGEVPGRAGSYALPRSVNLISGPSRTADIEQTIVRGAHGPKRLHVVILG